jgi:hypothetical protein
MATTVAKLEAVLGADTKGFDRGMSQADSTMGKTAKGIGTGAKLAGAAILGLGGVAAISGKKFLDMASDAGEVDSKLSVVFGKNLPSVTVEIEKFSKATGASKFELREQAANMGALLGPMLGSKKAASDMSVEMVKLATDLGSFNNIPMAEALEKIRAGLVGEAEPLRSMGVLINDAAVKTEAYTSGLAKQGAELTEQQKVQARYQLILKQTEQAQGDATRTSDSMANQMKRLQSSFNDAGTELGMKLIPVALKAVSAFNDNWPQIQEVVGKVFAALGAAWNSVGKPVLENLMTAAKAVVEWLRANWPEISRISQEVFSKVRDVIQDVVAWFNANLKPTIASIAENVREHWGTIEKVTKAVWGALERTIRPLLEALRAAINVILAVIRGDWETAWENLKKIPGAILRAIAASVESFASLFKVAAKALGEAIVAGLKAGIESGADLVKQAIEWLSDQIPGWAKKILQIESPSKRMIEIGRSITDGMAVGVLEQKLKLANALMEVLNAAVDKARDRVSRVGGNLSNVLSSAFSARQGAAQTKSEKRLQAIEELEAERSRNNALTAAEKALTAARLDETERRGELIAAAEEQLRQAQLAITVAALQAQAAEERKELDARLAFEQINFQNRLAALQGYLSSGEATAAGATARIKDFMSDFGISMGAIGELLGDNYAQGIRNMIPAAVRAATELTEAVAAALAGQKVVTKIEKALTVAEKAEAAAMKRGQDMNKALGLGAYAAGGVGALPSDAGSTSRGTSDLQGAGPELGPFAALASSMGLSISSGYYGREGDITKNGTLSDHAKRKALDFVGSASQMAAFFRRLVGNSGVRQAFYDPLGSIFGGSLSSYREGGHSDHVHVATYDKGGWLKPGLTLAYNGTGAPERVGGRGDVHLHFHGDMYGQPPRQFFKQVRDGLRELDLLQTGGRVLNATPTLS